MQKEQYRPDIDGLRAVAVIAVLLHHLNAGLVPGGFIGVDIFFVISGYLITSHIYCESLNGKFSFASFYKRRISRIVPALFAVMLASVVAGIFILSPVDFERLTSSALLALGGLSNFYFWREYGNYFSSNVSEAVLLHTWSLGVEEQFYLLWPMAFILIVKVIPRFVVVALLSLTIAGAVFSEYATSIVPSASYYLLPTRFFELTLGGTLAVVSSPGAWQGRKFTYACKLAGYCLIGYGFIALNPQSVFPGLNALYPSFGAALLIIAGKSGYPSRLLSNRPMVSIGLLSYSAYLWHWPIIAYMHYLGISIDITTGFFAIVATFTLAWLTWRCIETPFRHNVSRLTFAGIFVKRLALPACSLLVLLAASWHFQGFPGRFPQEVSDLEASVQTKPNELRKGCHVPNAAHATPPNPGCKLGVAKSVTDAVLIGDSFANHFSGMVDVLATAEGLSVMDYTMDGCVPIIQGSTALRTNVQERCALRNEYALNMIEQTKYGYVILAGSWPDGAEYTENILATLKRVTATGSKVVVILANQYIVNAATCPVRKLMFDSSVDCSSLQGTQPVYWASVRDQFPDVQFIDPNRYICNAGTCRPVVESVLLYRDNGHLNDVGSRLLGQFLLKENQGISKNTAFMYPLVHTQESSALVLP
ncbi:MAG TPA: acyltransferase family protein [Candidimonas sp.]|nr:acyltransferase family protein [Candidimonas sp.]